MPNMQPGKTPMREQPGQVRNRNFDEVTLGYTEEEAMNEAARCLNCKHKPCMEGCPVNVKIPEFIALMAAGDFEGAYRKITETNALPAICGRVCPQESQCEKHCVRGVKGEPVGIGRLERFAADWARANGKAKEKAAEPNGKKVAVIGSGPAGLSCAGELQKLGYKVTVFEALHAPGGVLMYGIPEFRLPKEIVLFEIDKLKDMGVELLTNQVIGKITSVSELMEDEKFDAVFIGTGAGLPSFMGIEGENLNGVYSANELLTRINLMKAYKFPEYDTPLKIGKKVAVVGGGNVAMDAARCAKRMGADEVYIVYRRSEEEMPARNEEIHHAKEEEIRFELLTNPTKILGENGSVTGMECVRMALGEPDASGRRRPEAVEGSQFVLDVDTVVMAIGQTPNPLIKNTTEGLLTNPRGCIVAEEETGLTSLKNVYAGGDTVTGAATVILAMGAGKKAAKAIDEKLRQSEAE